jgi:RHS repeat-associated protein
LLAERSYNNANGSITVDYQHTDALGSPASVTDAWAAITDRIWYSPYGIPLNHPVEGPGYTGHVMDQLTGLTYMQQRYYDPALGRFLSVDPMDVNTATAINFNRFNYAANNPYRFTDPDGRCAIACTVLAGAAIGGIFSGGLEVYRQYKAGKGYNIRAIGVEAGRGAVVGAVAGSMGLLGAGMATSAGAGKIGIAATELAMSGAGAGVTTLATGGAADVMKGQPLRPLNEALDEAKYAAAGTVAGGAAGKVAGTVSGRVGVQAGTTGGRIVSGAIKGTEEAVSSSVQTRLQERRK